MMGLPPSDLPEWWRTSGYTPSALGANCGVGPADVVIAVDDIRTADSEVVIVAKANCGVPQMIDGTLWYPTATDDMSAYARLALDAGARIVGACCGSVPEHLAQIRRVVDSHQPGSGVDRDEVASRLGGSVPSGGGDAPTRERRSRRRG
jgi:5-methyltetrahydrofolate--homocysteine methyltransferase